MGIYFCISLSGCAVQVLALDIWDNMHRETGNKITTVQWVDDSRRYGIIFLDYIQWI